MSSRVRSGRRLHSDSNGIGQTEQDPPGFYSHSKFNSEDARAMREKAFEETLHMIGEERDPEQREMLKKTVGWLFQKRGDNIHVDLLLTYLEAEKKQTKKGKRLTLSMAFFVTYAVMVTLHGDVVRTGAAQRHIRNLVIDSSFEGNEYTSGHKTFFDIAEIPDIYKFLAVVLLPTFLHEDPHATISQGGAAELSRVLRYSKLIGGVQLQQQRRKAKTCTELHPSANPRLMQNFQCYASLTIDDFTDDCYGPLAFDVRAPGDRQRLPGGFCGDDTNEASESESSLYRRLDKSWVQDVVDVVAKVVGAPPSPLRGGTTRTSLGSERPAGNVKTGAPGEASPRRRRSVTSSSRGAPPRRLRVTSRKRSKPNAAAGISFVPGVDVSYGATYSSIFSSAGGMPVANVRLNWLREHNWLDMQSQRVSARMLVFNPSLNAYTHISVIVFFGMGGELFPILKTVTFVAEPYQQMSILVADCVFLLLLSILIITGIVKSARHRSAIAELLKDPWFWADGLVMGGGLVLVALWMVTYVMIDGVKELIIKASNAEHQYTLKTLPGSMEDESERNQQTMMDLHYTVGVFSDFLGYYRTFIGSYTIICICGFFHGFHMQPRLSMVTTTFQRCLVELAHHMIVVVALACAFALSGMFLFGRRIFEYSTFVLSFLQVGLLMLGDLQWEQLSEENPTTAAIWITTAAIVLTLLLVNMLVAIVMDVYAEVKAIARSADPIWSQVNDWARAYRQTQNWVSAAVISRVVRQKVKDQGVEKVSTQDLKALVPGLTQEQCTKVFSNALKKQEVEDSFAMSLAQMIQMIGHILVITTGAVNKLDALIKKMPNSGYLMDSVLTQRREEAEERERKQLDPKSSPKDRTQPWRCEEFHFRIDRIRDHIRNIELFVQDTVTWTTHRGRRMQKQIEQVQVMLTDRLRARILQQAALPGPAPPVAASLLDDSMSNAERFTSTQTQERRAPKAPAARPPSIPASPQAVMLSMDGEMAHQVRKWGRELKITMPPLSCAEEDDPPTPRLGAAEAGRE